MWRLNSPEMNPLEYHAWETVQGLSQAPPKLNMVAELNEMLKLFTLSTMYTLARLLCAHRMTTYVRKIWL